MFVVIDAVTAPEETPEGANTEAPAAETPVAGAEVDNDPLSTLASAAITAASKTEPEEVKVIYI